MTTATQKHQLLYGGEDDYISRWVSERMPETGPDGISPCTAIGVQSGGRLIAGVVYFDYYPEHSTIQLGIASISPMWARKETIFRLLSYPFYQLGVFKCWTAIASDNEKALKATKHIGFKPEATLASHFGRGRHGIISRMFKSDFERLYGGI